MALGRKIAWALSVDGVPVHIFPKWREAVFGSALGLWRSMLQGAERTESVYRNGPAKNRIVSTVT